MAESPESRPFQVENTQGRWYRGPSRRRVGRRAPYSEGPAYSEPRQGSEGGAARGLAWSAFGIARLVRLVAGIVAAIIVAGILLVVLNANPTNDIVSAIHDAAKWLVGPFDGMFTLDSVKATIGVNWGIAAIVYLIVGALIARAIELIGVAGLRERNAPRD